VSLIKVYKVGGVAEEIGQLQTAFPDMHPLAGVRVKLERARKHLVTLNGEVAAFLERTPYEIFDERRRGGRELISRVRAHETPPLAWSAIAGDCMQNMRSALNYLAWELACLEGDPPHQTAFPIYVTPERFSERYNPTHKLAGQPTPRSGLHKIEGMGPEVQSTIVGLQPFNGQYGLSPGVVPTRGWRPLWENHPLSRLEKLAGLDRHRALRVVGATSTSHGGANPSGSPKPEHGEVNLGPLEDGAVVARYVFSEPGAALRSTGLTVNMQLQAEGETMGSSVILTLESILSHLDDTVMPRFTQFF
jgi:hypothetical protein